MAAAIEIRAVTKRFEGRTILDRVTTRFERGEVTLLVGESGAGKSTLLRCINGLERFDEGAIVVGDLEIGPDHGRRDRHRHADTPLLRRVRMRAGMVFQHYGLFSHMTALANVMEAPIHVAKKTPAEAKEIAEALLGRVGLSHRKDALPRELSGGEQQRVAIARALAMAPDVLLLDEPTSALDPERKADVASVLRDLAKDGTTMVVVTHDAALLQDIAGKKLVLARGRIEAEAAT